MTSGNGSTSKFGMRLVGFDAEVARAHGYAVVTLPDGSQASVPADKAEAAREGDYIPKTGILKPSTGDVSVSGYGELPGDCGISWVYLDGIGGSKAVLGTGFSTTPDAGEPWDVNWHVAISDLGGLSEQHYNDYSGFLGFLSWTAYARQLSLTRGSALATVLWWKSFTITDNGWVCWSLGPQATTTIY